MFCLPDTLGWQRHSHSLAGSCLPGSLQWPHPCFSSLSEKGSILSRDSKLPQPPKKAQIQAVASIKPYWLKDIVSLTCCIFQERWGKKENNLSRTPRKYDNTMTIIFLYGGKCLSAYILHKTSCFLQKYRAFWELSLGIFWHLKLKFPLLFLFIHMNYGSEWCIDIRKQMRNFLPHYALYIHFCIIFFSEIRRSH